jgi:phosphate/sulfate permease
MDMYLILIILLGAIALLDLLVGVSNDAVNFLNSAVGSKVASMRTILIVASLGIVLGTLFSNGMMEVARKGVFDPSFFSFHDILMLFLAVMLTDVLLLDIYNSLGLPTSTTVSLVFELLGAGSAVGLLVAYSRGLSFDNLSEFIDFESTGSIVFGIFSSVGVAFTAGVIVQYLSRVAFSFKLERSLRFFGGVFSGLSATFIVYFLLVKGVKGSSLVSSEEIEWVEQNQLIINTISFVFFTLLSHVLLHFKVNPLRMVVLLGTFSLAMAFAGNDLVNFIGVAVGAYHAYLYWVDSGVPATEFRMGALAEKVDTPLVLLFIAGVVMIITLWTSAKARKVSETEIGLSKQDEGNELFGSNALSRALVGGVLGIQRAFGFVRTDSGQSFLESRFEKTGKEDPTVAFDLVRASVNLLVSSVLIAYATSLKLPLSTTYVTFMVAMGSSLSDRAWGRESAVYRVAGVLNVIGSWLVTALVAFSGAALVGVILFYTGFWGAIIIAALAGGALIRSHWVFKKSEAEKAAMEKKFAAENTDVAQVIADLQEVVTEGLQETQRALSLSFRALVGENSDVIMRLQKSHEKHLQKQSKLQLRLMKSVRKMGKDFRTEGALNIMVMYQLADATRAVQTLLNVTRDHVNNHHKFPHRNFVNSVMELNKAVDQFFGMVIKAIQSNQFHQAEAVLELKLELIVHMEELLVEQVGLLQADEIGARQGQLQTHVLLDTRDAVASVHRVFALYAKYQKDRSL